ELRGRVVAVETDGEQGPIVAECESTDEVLARDSRVAGRDDAFELAGRGVVPADVVRVVADEEIAFTSIAVGAECQAEQADEPMACRRQGRLIHEYRRHTRIDIVSQDLAWQTREGRDA